MSDKPKNKQAEHLARAAKLRAKKTAAIQVAEERAKRPGAKLVSEEEKRDLFFNLRE